MKDSLGLALDTYVRDGTLPKQTPKERPEAQHFPVLLGPPVVEITASCVSMNASI